MPQHLSTIFWSNREEPNQEYCTLWQNDSGFLFEGVALLTAENTPVQISYQVRCDTEWRTQIVIVEMTAGGVSRNLTLTVDDEGHWWRGEQKLTDFQDCIDVDLGFTPATNTLPIRRLALDVGQSATINTAWIKFPELTIEAFPQRYTRQSDTTYLFESLNSDFKAVLEVNDVGLVTDYEGLWQTIAQR